MELLSSDAIELASSLPEKVPLLLLQDERGGRDFHQGLSQSGQGDQHCVLAHADQGHEGSLEEADRTRGVETSESQLQSQEHLVKQLERPLFLIGRK